MSPQNDQKDLEGTFYNPVECSLNNRLHRTILTRRSSYIYVDDCRWSETGFCHHLVLDVSFITSIKGEDMNTECPERNASVKVSLTVYEEL